MQGRKVILKMEYDTNGWLEVIWRLDEAQAGGAGNLAPIFGADAAKIARKAIGLCV